MDFKLKKEEDKQYYHWQEQIPKKQKISSLKRSNNSMNNRKINSIKIETNTTSKLKSTKRQPKKMLSEGLNNNFKKYTKEL